MKAVLSPGMENQSPLLCPLHSQKHYLVSQVNFLEKLGVLIKTPGVSFIQMGSKAEVGSHRATDLVEPGRQGPHGTHRTGGRTSTVSTSFPIRKSLDGHKGHGFLGRWLPELGEVRS